MVGPTVTSGVTVGKLLDVMRDPVQSNRRMKELEEAEGRAKRAHETAVAEQKKAAAALVEASRATEASRKEHEARVRALDVREAELAEREKVARGVSEQLAKAQRAHLATVEEFTRDTHEHDRRVIAHEEREKALVSREKALVQQEASIRQKNEISERAYKETNLRLERVHRLIAAFQADLLR